MRVTGVMTACLVAPALLLGSAGVGQCSKVSKTAPSAPSMKVQEQVADAEPKAGAFRVPSVQQLQSAKQGLRRLSITGPGERPLTIPGVAMRVMDPGAGCPDYASGSGVVLRPLQPWNESSGSTLILRGVLWNERVRRQVARGDPETSFGLYVGRETVLAANAYFQNLPAATHTYMLTLGTSAPKERLRIRIGGTVADAASLVGNTETNEVRALFTYEAGRYENRVAIYVHYLPDPSGSDSVYFHHIQLAQLD